MKKKTVALILALTLLVCAAVGGTIAYLTARSQTVQNTFTLGRIGTLSLVETKGTAVGGDANHRTFEVVPAMDVEKDPKVTYTYADGNAEAYIFVKINMDGRWTFDSESGKFTHPIGSEETQISDGLSFVPAEGWTVAKYDATGHYVALGYGTSSALTAVDETLSGVSVINNGRTDAANADDALWVSPDVTEEHVDADNEGVGDLKLTAYAIQADWLSDGNAPVTPQAAWTTLAAQNDLG